MLTLHISYVAPELPVSNQEIKNGSQNILIILFLFYTLSV